MFDRIHEVCERAYKDKGISEVVWKKEDVLYCNVLYVPGRERM